MSNRKRRVVLQSDTTWCHQFAQKLTDKGYEVMLKKPDTEEVISFPL